MSKASDDDVAVIADTETEPEPEPAFVENKDVVEMVNVKDTENNDEIDTEMEKKIDKDEQEMSDGGEDENDDVSAVKWWQN